MFRSQFQKFKNQTFTYISKTVKDILKISTDLSLGGAKAIFDNKLEFFFHQITTGTLLKKLKILNCYI